MKKWQWSFLWTRLDGPRRKDGSRVYRERRYIGPSLQTACDKMCQWLEDRPFPVAIDYEAMLVGAIRGTAKEVSMPRIDDLDHPIAKWALWRVLGCSRPAHGAPVAESQGEVT